MKFHPISKEKQNILKSVPTPSYVLDEENLVRNLERLAMIQERTGAKVLLAQKCFATTALYPLIAKYLWGTVASGLYEARLAHEEFHVNAKGQQTLLGETLTEVAAGQVSSQSQRQLENHVFEPAYHDSDMPELNSMCDHIIFNSWNQFYRHKDKCKCASLGIRVNPECSTQGAAHAIYDPCAPGSRLGIRIADMPAKLPPEIKGFHMHTLCEQGVDDLERTVGALEAKFGEYLPQLEWLNLGGGHYIAHEDYDVEGLIKLLNYLREKYDLQVYLEPGEGVVLNAGYMVTTVMDKVQNGVEILILDASAACHFPDVIEGPFLPPVYGGYEVPGGNALAGLYDTGHPYTYRLASMTCLAGDVIGDYTFDKFIEIGDKLILEDMALYTIVKNNTFNGMPLPDIHVLHRDGSVELIKKFGYEDFKGRLG